MYYTYKVSNNRIYIMEHVEDIDYHRIKARIIGYLAYNKGASDIGLIVDMPRTSLKPFTMDNDSAAKLLLKEG